MRVALPHRPLGPEAHSLILALVLTWTMGRPVLAETAVPRASTTTFIVFADHRMPDAEWDYLASALRKGAEPLAAKSDRPLQILRGDSVPAEQLQVDNPVSVYLHGDCKLTPMSRVAVTGALGWVYRDHGSIGPFVHVDCERIARMLGPFALGMSRDRCAEVMGEAMAHVVMHEWIHIATQSAKHSDHGVSKSRFNVRDLLAGDEEFERHRELLNDRRWPEL